MPVPQTFNDRAERLVPKFKPLPTRTRQAYTEDNPCNWDTLVRKTVEVDGD